MQPTAERLLTGMLMLAVILMIWTQGAQSALVINEAAVEATLDQVRLPQREFGQLSLRRCPACTVETWRVDADTRYLLGMQAVSLDEFLAAADDGPAAAAMLVIFHEPGGRRITRLRLSWPPGAGR
ncbi:MAG: hypothetical protein D6727_08105 [Gammaproteobacteria bacterium]|nr:MAG: hypothetical protein D6727_08105 [Gammaproteobacteria bacterium]